MSTQVPTTTDAPADTGNTGIIYLGSAVGDLADHHHAAVATALGWLGLCGFVGPYLFLVTRQSRISPAWWQLAVLGWMYVLAVTLSLSLGSPWLVLFVYVTMSAGVLLPVRYARWAVPAGALSLVGAGRLTGAGHWVIAAEAMPALLGGLGMMGIARLGRTLRELREARETIARLAADEERLRLARDLHDLLGHSLSLITLKSELAGRMLPDRPEEAARQVADIEQVSRQALVDVREAVSGYRRPTLGVELAGARTALRTAGVTMSRDGKRVYAANGGAGSVSVIDVATNKVVGDVKVGQRPWNMALTPDGKKLYVANGRSNSVSVIDTATRKVVKEIPVGELPWGVSIPQ